ncbi:hypothetical protein DUI87_02633 [Hirundo rustica rustica]|uniref:RNA-directed DNA polymerase n=1 Tax=Hirundo rustica rustica TaxID=333673 RepID=A0A3M0LCT2_HIRRU|nr:hypothetical protein DUI87_02633 [Hirundo rustica rustica]
MLLARCMHPPFYLVEGQVLAQAIPVPVEILADGKSPEVYWAEVVGENKPSLACNLARGSDLLHVEGVLDSGADVTIIPESMWPSHWELQPVAGKLQGIGGITMEDKVQRMPPWKYLRLQITARTIVLQKLEIECNPKTLANLHSLCGSLNWEGRNSPKRLTKEMFEHLLQSNAGLQLSLDSYRGQISVHAPSHKLLNEEFHLIPCEKRSRRPLKALTVFTDTSRASHKSVMTWRNPQTQRWEADVEFVEGSPQVAELAAVVRAFEKFSEPINLVTDSAYVAGVVSRAEQAVLKEIDNEHLFRLLSKLIYLISHREHPFYVMHVRSHTDLPGEIAEGNRQADSLAAPVEKARLPDIFQQAKLSHQQYHQNVPGLIHQFQLTQSQARAIVATCPNCQVQAMPSMGMGVNPWGLGSCEVWQTDIMHIPSFGRLKYVYVSIDTHSGAVYASAHAGEKTEHAKKHLVQAFSVLGIPKEIKTDNGPAYASKEFLEFVQQWGVEHKTGIPHSPTGQAVVERAHQMLKQVLARQSSTTVWMSPHEKLCKAMFTINFLNCSFENMSPPVVRHFNSGNQFKLSQRPRVMIRDPETWETKGPYELVTWGHGYACVATPSGPRWIPQKWVKPFVPKNPAPAEGDKRQAAVASKRRCRWM